MIVRSIILFFLNKKENIVIPVISEKTTKDLTRDGLDDFKTIRYKQSTNL